MYSTDMVKIHNRVEQNLMSKSRTFIILQTKTVFSYFYFLIQYIM